MFLKGFKGGAMSLGAKKVLFRGIVLKFLKQFGILSTLF